MLAKITKSYQYEDEKDYEKFVSGSFEAIVKHARSLVPPDSEEAYTIEHDFRGKRDILDSDGKKIGVDEGENKIALVHWVDEPSTDPDYPDEPDHYWKFALTVAFVEEVVEECKDEVVAI